MKAMKRSLVASGSYNTNRVKMGFCLIGDPAVKLAYPEYGRKFCRKFLKILFGREFKNRYSSHSSQTLAVRLRKNMIQE